MYQSLRPKGLFTRNICARDIANKQVQYFPTVELISGRKIYQCSDVNAIADAQCEQANSLVQSMIPYLQELQPNNMIKSKKQFKVLWCLELLALSYKA